MRDLFASFLLLLCAATTAQGSALHDAAKSGDLRAIAAALDAGADIEEQEKGATPLFLAVRSGHVEAAELLIERGADVNKEAVLGLPMTVAVLKSAADMVGLLLAHGADANGRTRGEPMLTLAVANDCLDCVKVLVEAGADVNAIWLQGDPSQRPGIITAYHLAKHDDHEDIAAYLLEHGVVILRPEPISARLAKGDPIKGGALFKSTCAPCHVVRPKELPTIGPNLWNVVGRDKSSTEFERYSKTLLGWEGNWTYEDLNIFLAGPTLTTPGVNMDIRGVLDEADRVNVIAYLRTLADAPVPLP
ncbi:ankyrin repeat domain-containing protein [Mesorhizobium sp.]|uniref:ankyrin repeat domain-containing protein n=1 Tax=Mesorhizobium sp. TaxID=1871066 RepID=UPI000FE55074|nr:ankyrin repeat domain-containing protein [Mesorhizobium sp.]RWI16794.1 MAG: c-type cytochrome [Mesorhizobium sp.]RWN08715.1 MAG: c-type cytochrome [Mesorhizobium sp.]RWN16141.1 MAG: c-type cytochrome [Mesorhizobium sp.]TIQ97557.1 MAG: c-type cytochrome [Mesorhizobium sp.]